MPDSSRRALCALVLLAAVATDVPASLAQTADALLAPDAPADPPADTSAAALRVETARLDLARAELAALSRWQRLRPSLSAFVSLSTRGLAFPAVSAQGFDPAYAALARYPGDAWGLTLSWNAEALLDRRPLVRARAAVTLAYARLDLAHARRDEAVARDRARDRDRAERLAAARRRAGRAAAELRVEASFLARRLDAQRELLRLAEMTHAQGEGGFEALARQRLAVLAAEHAAASNAARLATLDAALADPAALAADDLGDTPSPLALSTDAP